MTWPSAPCNFCMCFCCKIRTAIQVDHRFGGYDAKTIPRIHPRLRAPAVNHNMCKALRFPLCPLCALCVCSLLQVCLDSINTLLPDWTVTLVFDTCSFLFSYVSFFCFVFYTLPYSTIRRPHAVASNQRQPSSAPTLADLLALVSTTPIRSLHIPACHPETPYDTIYDPGFGYAYKDSPKGFVRTALVRILPPSNSKSLFFGPIPCFSLSFLTARSLQI